MAAHSPLESPTRESLVTAALLQRVRAEYRELPGLMLTAAQAQRLWGLDCFTTRTVMATLVEAGFLSRTLEGLFVMAAPPRSGPLPYTDSGMLGASDLVGAYHARADQHLGQHDNHAQRSGAEQRGRDRATTSSHDDAITAEVL